MFPSSADTGPGSLRPVPEPHPPPPGVCFRLKVEFLNHKFRSLLQIQENGLDTP